MNSKELREKFLKFFEERGHKIIPSASLIPENDSSVLFTTAGMQQFKPYYLEQKNPQTDKHWETGKPLGGRNVVSCQKCFRTTDIEQVGDVSHLTFFEMLGNFSFGGYFKKEAINYAWEFIHDILKIQPDRIKISVFAGDKELSFDKESFQIWKQLGLEKQIVLGDRKDNFWGPTGEEGPCGPTTEIYIDGIEIWNLVFNEYYQQTDKKLRPLSLQGVDTGMGLERLCLVMQYPEDDTKTIFDTDLFRQLMDYLHQQGDDKVNENIYRIIADHLRAATFLAATGVVPSNVEQGYILRRLIRRIVRFGRMAQLQSAWLEPALVIIKNKYGAFYPEINEKEKIQKVIETEEEKFEKTLARGLKMWEKLAAQLIARKEKVVSGEIAFPLYESYGFPLELIEEMAQENGLIVDRKGFEKMFQQHRFISRAGKEKKFGGHGLNKKLGTADEKRIVKLHTATHLLLAALRNILDSNITQKGSDINSERLRFDFSFPRKLTAEEIEAIENWVNSRIKENLTIVHEETSYQEALAKGALGSFQDRYPERVTVYTILSSENQSPCSQEICAGPHVQNTGEIGHFRILKEESVSQGVRRIKATIE